MKDARQVANEATEAFNAHDERRIRETYAPNVITEAPGGVRSEGPEASTDYAMVWLRAFPDARITIKNQIVAGDWIAEEFTFEGTHKEPLAGPGGEIPATGKSITGHGVQISRIENGKIAENRLYFDQVEVLTQLGLMPEPATA
jgi:predicted ester cyclase